MVTKRRISHRVEFVFAGNTPSMYTTLPGRNIEELIAACRAYYSNEEGRFYDRPDFVGVRYKGVWLL